MLLSVAGKHKHLEKDSMKMFEDWREIAINYVPKGLTRKERQYIVEEDRGNLYKDLENNPFSLDLQFFEHESPNEMFNYTYMSLVELNI